jgi:stage III sporulation protein AF
MTVIYEWIENIAFYSILQVLVLHLLPSGEQKKYVRFFMGLVFLIILFGPLLSWEGGEIVLNHIYEKTVMEQELAAFFRQQEKLEQEIVYYAEQIQEEREMTDGEEGESLVEPIRIRIGGEEAISP